MSSSNTQLGTTILITGDDHNGKSSLIDSYENGRLASGAFMPDRTITVNATLPMDEPLDFGRVDQDSVVGRELDMNPRWRTWKEIPRGGKARNNALQVRITFQDDTIQDDTIGPCGEDRRSRYCSASVIALCFSLIHRDALEYIPHRWLPEIRHWAPNTPIVLIGTMVDLRDSSTSLSLTHKFGTNEPRLAISTEEGKRMARQIGAVRYAECSASQNINIQETFALLAMLAGERLLLSRRHDGTHSRKVGCIIA